MKYTLTETQSGLEARLSERLIFSDHSVFSNMFEEMKQYGKKNIKIDLSELQFIDSSGLGMLLLANQNAKTEGAELILARPEGQVAKVFMHLSFHSLFTIEP